MNPWHPNTRRVSFPATWGDDQSIPLTLDPYQGVFDENGYLRLCSFPLFDHTIAHLQLLPLDQGTDVALGIAKDLLSSFGMSTVSNAIFAGGTAVVSIVKYVIERFGGFAIEDVFEKVRIAHSGYYSMTSGGLMIVHPVRLSRA